MPRLILTDGSGHLVTFHRTATTASLFDRSTALLTPTLSRTPELPFDPKSPAFDPEKTASAEMSYAALGLLRAAGDLPWVPKALLSGIQRRRLVWIVYDAGED